MERFKEPAEVVYELPCMQTTASGETHSYTAEGEAAEETAAEGEAAEEER